VKLKQSTREQPDVNLTPLIDVVFLLLIFFMVSTTFQQDSELSIELPEASTEAPPEADRNIRVAIDAQGRFYINGRQLVNTQTATLKQALKSALGGHETLPVVINADRQSSYQSVVTVMDTALSLGLVQLKFTHQSAPEDGQ